MATSFFTQLLNSDIPLPQDQGINKTSLKCRGKDFFRVLILRQLLIFQTVAPKCIKHFKGKKTAIIPHLTTILSTEWQLINKHRSYLALQRHQTNQCWFCTSVLSLILFGLSKLISGCWCWTNAQRQMSARSRFHCGQKLSMVGRCLAPSSLVSLHLCLQQ